MLGYSHTRRQVLTVILVHRHGSSYYGANGWASNSSDRRRHEEGE
ncbi:hypothetical protein [Tomitella cavernea]|nr:hypothetical protein [Tomitella cavernea]